LGSSNGIQFAISVTVFDLSGLVKAYTSVLSCCGSPAVSGASRWEEAFATPPLNPAMPVPASAATAKAAARLRPLCRFPCDVMRTSLPQVNRPELTHGQC